ncbi:hypothetical protein [Clostridium paridis]|uniref:Radical SAM protein n=1 Tax=Clostridium paridis TaxID=2803863 RepID=A0A937FJ70_9CLOT|nr:hypothetical protein [Clostridium paridis]MBL4933213.1 hypothetical protein [Clostridium paridis]
MKIGIIDADLMDNGTRHPNLALMKIAGYHIELGNEVKLIYKSYDYIREYDKVYISCVFSFTYIPEWVINEPNVVIGGTGFYEDGGAPLPYDIEHHKPYYDLYKEYIEAMTNDGKNPKRYSDYLNYSIGFTTRGCFRKCDFCVNKKYDKVQRHSKVNEFLDNDRPMIYLWDDNILAYSRWEEVLDELVETGKPFQFRQGMDIRLMTQRKAFRFNNVKYHGDFIFAFDHLSDRELIIDKIQMWKRYTNKQPKMYVLSGFESQDEFDIENVFERISILMRYGCLPYIMRHKNYKKSKYSGMYIQIARWCNQPQFYKKMSFREFCERNQFYHSNSNTYCASYRAMLEFEKDNPEIASKYFDKKFNDENIYLMSYGYGRRYCNKQECRQCKLSLKCWDDIVNGKVRNDEIIKLYYSSELDSTCLEYKNAECSTKPVIAGQFLSKFIINVNTNEIYNFIKNSENELPKKELCILPEQDDKYYINLLNEIFKSDMSKEVRINRIIEELNIEVEKDKKVLIKSLKLLAIMDFIILSKGNKDGKIKLSPLGKELMSLNRSKQRIIWQNNTYRIPIFQHYISINGIERDFENSLNKIGINDKEKYISDCKKINQMMKKSFDISVQSV